MCRVREKSTSHSFTCSYLTILEPFGKDVVLSLMYIFGFFFGEMVVAKKKSDSYRWTSSRNVNSNEECI